MANLYEINAELLKCVDWETGELIDADRLSELEMEYSDKVENIALWIKNLSADADALSNEIKNLQARKKACESKMDSLKKYLSNNVADSFETSKCKISFRNSKAVNVDLNELMKYDNCDVYLKYKDLEPDKTVIKEALKSGVNVPGCQLVENRNIQIK